MFWSSPYAEVDNEYNGKLISFEFDVKEAANLSDEIIRFNFVEAFDKGGNPVGGVSSKFAVDVCEVKVGDVDGSDRVNIWDAVLLRQHYFDGSDAKLLMDASDTNYDGNKTSVDSTYLNRYVVGLYGYYGADGTPGRYKINFKGNGFEDYTDYLTVGDEILAPPVEDEKSFRGWYDNPDFEGEPITEVGHWTGGEFTLWAKVGYPIYYNISSRRPEDFINYDELPTWYYCDEENPFKFDFTLEADGLTFKGWKDSYHAIPEEGFTKMPGALNLTPLYDSNTYDIYARIYLEGHVDITEKIGTYEYTMLSSGSTIDKRLVSNLAPSIAGYVGGDIYKDAEFNEICGVNTYYVSTPYLGNGKAGDFYLYYKYVPMKYNITFDWGYEGAPETNGITYEYAAEGFKLPTEIPARSGYTFAGWNLVYTDMYGRNHNLPVTRTEYDKYWLLDYVTVRVIDVEFVAQWTADGANATISTINTLTGLTTRYTFDSSIDYTIPDSKELILVGDVYYKFDGWYSTPDCQEGTLVTQIPANTFDVNNSRYYSKWVKTTSSKIIVHNRDTEEVIGEIEVTPGDEYILPDATEYVNGIFGDKYISNGAFYTKSETTYTEVTSFNINFTEKDIYVDVVDVSNMVANIFTVSNYASSPWSRNLGVKLDGVTYLFENTTEEKVYTIYTSSDKISEIEVLYQYYNRDNHRADIKYRAEFGGKVIEKERQIRYSDKYAGYDRVIYTPIIKDEYTLDLYVPEYGTYGNYLSGSTYDKAIQTKISGLNLLEGYPIQVTRGEKITLPVLDDLCVTEFSDSKWVEYMEKCGLSDEQKATLKLKFVGWFDRPYYTQIGEKPITEIDTSMIGQDIQLYAIYEPEALLVEYTDGTYGILSGENLDIVRLVYTLTGNPNEKLYDTSQIENGRLVKAMPNKYAYSYLVKSDVITTISHPYANSSAETNMYSGGPKYDSSTNTTGWECFFVKDSMSPSYYGPYPSLEE